LNGLDTFFSEKCQENRVDGGGNYGVAMVIANPGAGRNKDQTRMATGDFSLQHILDIILGA